MDVQFSPALVIGLILVLYVISSIKILKEYEQAYGASQK